MKKSRPPFMNPFRPGAGHMPPFLAGRQIETEEFRHLLDQTVILENLVLTGLRGVGKTVLLETFKPLALQEGWHWVGTDLSESASVSDEAIATRLMADLAVLTSSVVIDRKTIRSIGFQPDKSVEVRFDYRAMIDVFNRTPGLVIDKLKTVLELAWECFRGKVRGLIFAYDEAQNLSDHAAKDQYPLSLMLDAFQSVQKKGVPFMVVLTGLPTLFPKLVDARTYSERMFHVVFLDRLNKKDSADAIMKPIKEEKSPLKMEKEEIDKVVHLSGGYPYFIQFLGREMYDFALRACEGGSRDVVIPFDAIIRKLDGDFFSGRWAKATDRQRDLLTVIAHLENADSEFTVQEVTQHSRSMLKNPFSPSHANQMLAKLCDLGLVYKNRHGKYSFAVPLLERFILRQCAEDNPDL
jgi:hypothetical protein